MRQHRGHALACLWAACTLLLPGCRTPPQVADRPVVTATPAAPPTTPAPPAPTGRPEIAIEANATGKLAVTTPHLRTAKGTAQISAMSAAESAALIGRLEPLPDLTAQNAHAPAMRAPSAAPPRAGAVQPISFVVPTGKPITDAPIAPGKPGAAPVAPMAAPQILPQGEIGAELEVRIRFAEPMIPIAELDAAPKPPIAITPPVPGTWRWIDTRVLMFTPTAPRLAQATEYTVTVPAGIHALSGATLGAAVTGTFSTPPVTIQAVFPRLARPDSPIAIKLDQDIDPAALLAHLRVATDRKQRIAVRPIGIDEARALWARNPRLPGGILLDPELGAHYVLLAPTSAWPAGASMQVTLTTGAPSKEGPRKTTRERFGTFGVVPAFSLLGVSCSGGRMRLSGEICPARGVVSVELSNDIALASYRSENIQIEGQPLDDQAPRGGWVSLNVPEFPGRTYQVAVKGALVDVYGQPFVGPRRASFATTLQRFDPMVSVPTGVHVLDPRFEIPQWVLSTQAVTAVRIQLYQVHPAEFFAYEQFEAGKRTMPPGKLISDRSYPVGARYGADLRVDLRPALGPAGTGHVIAVATADPAIKQRTTEWYSRKNVAWIQVTRLGVSARLDGEKLSAWTADLRPDHFLAPRANVNTQLLVEGHPEITQRGVSDASGHAAFELHPRIADKKPGQDPYGERPHAVLVLDDGQDSLVTSITGYEHAVRAESARWYVTDDRFTYKPGEKVYVKGWVRWTHNGVNPDLAQPRAGEAVTYTLQDARGNKLATGTAPLSDQGGFDLEVELPKSPNLGMARFSFETRGSTHGHPISIQEFRTPAFAVTLDDDVPFSGALPLVLGESLQMTAGAKYYAGGGLPGADITWDATLATTRFRPAGWDLYSFEPVLPRSTRHSYYGRRYDHVDSIAVAQPGTLSGASAASIVYGIAALPAGRPAVLSVDATVTDVDRMTIRASSRSILVHPSTYYVGLRLRPEQTSSLLVIVTDLEGKPVKGVPVTVDLEGVLGSERDRDDAKVIDTQHCTLTSDTTPVTCSFTRKDGKTAYTAVAHVADARGRVNVAQYDVPWWAYADDRRSLSIVPDRPTYRPGDVAKLEIRSAQLPATAVVSFARQGLIAQKRLELTAASTFVELPIEIAYIQDVHVQVDRWAKRVVVRDGSTLPLPEHMATEITLPVELDAARLVMTTRPTSPLVEPGANATFEVTVAHDDHPVANAEVALIVVDEAVLALSTRSHEDPLASFYRELGAGTSHLQTFDMVYDSGPELAGGPGFQRYKLEEHGGTGSGFGYGSGAGSLGGSSRSLPSVGLGVVVSRKDFRANAVFSPRLHTDAQGKVSLTVKMPDNLTRFRVIALATAATHLFGKAENVIVTQRKVNARSVTPRFLNQGDSFFLPVVVQNLDSAPRTVDVAVRAANLAQRGPAAKRVTIPGGQRAELRFELATQQRGRAVVQTIATSGDFADASQLDIPVYEPATTESFATYGTVDDATKFEQLDVPADIFPDVGGVEVEVASTQLQSLTDAFWYLYAYPYECAEQRSSRMLATAAMYDVLEAFETPSRPTRADLAATVATDLKKLARDQLGDGSWGYFPGMHSDEFVTFQVLAALAAHHAPEGKGTMRARATAFVTRAADAQLARLAASVAKPADQRRDRAELPAVVSLAASALASLGSAGVDVHARVLKLHAAAIALEAYPVDAKARVLAQLAGRPADKAIRQKLVTELTSVIHETASSATVTTSYAEAERLLLVSSTRTSALTLDALIREVPEHPLITKLARGVLDGRRGGRWRSTQENLVVLQAMRRYFDTYEKATPNFTGKLWLGKAAYAEQAFVGRSGRRGTAQVDWTALPAGSSHDVAIAKDGPGRMYYRVGITYAPKRTDLPALDAGFVVRRSYTAVDDPADVQRQPDGRWRIRLGARVLVTIEALNTARRDAVAIVDPLPAGFEAVNTALATAERAVTTTASDAWDYLNLRDNRAEVFAMQLAEGRHRFSYTVRATTPGVFLAAPAKAEEMYSPETFGRSTGQTVVIE